MAHSAGAGRRGSDHHLRLSRWIPHLLPLAVLATLGSPTAGSAAWVVYADSWTSPTQAQEQAIRINRTLSVETATYERATVQGRVFWRVRVGVYRTRDEALQVRRRLTDARIAETWMREVSESDLPTEPALPIPRPPAKPDTARTDSVTQTIIDSLVHMTQRRVDSLETATHERLETIMRQMRGQLTQEMLEQIEQSMVRDRRTYVTQAEQAQMTRAILDEMSSHLDALRDSLRRERERQDALAALLPRIGGSVAANTTVEHERPEARSRSTAGSVRLPEAQASVGWSNERTDVLVDVRCVDLSAMYLRQGYVRATFQRAGSARQQIGMGIFERPYGLEPTRWADLLAASPSQLTSSQPTSYAGLWLVPYESGRIRVLLFPYGAWDEHTRSGLAQVRFTGSRALVELTAGASRDRDASGDRRETAEGHLVARWQGTRWLFGGEGLILRRTEPAYGELGYGSGLRRQVDTWGLLVLIHSRFARRWGWTARGDALAVITRWRQGLPTVPREPVWRRGTVTTGPVLYLGSRVRMSFMYTFDLIETRPTGGSAIQQDQAHRLEFGMSHVF